MNKKIYLLRSLFFYASIVGKCKSSYNYEHRRENNQIEFFISYALESPTYIGNISRQILKNFAIHEYNFLYKKKWSYTMPSSKKNGGFASFFSKNP